MRLPSKRMPTKKELGQLSRIYGPSGNIVFGKNGGVWIKGEKKVKPF